MKKIFFIASLAIFGVFDLFSQTTTYEYTYNSSGQRIKRNIVGSSFRMVNPQNLTEINKTNFSVSIFPNPTNEILNVKNENEQFDSEVFFNIVDMSGKIIKSGNYNSQLTQINVSQFPSALYLIQLYSDNKNITLEFIKN